MMEFLKEEGHDVDLLWQRIGDIMLKTLIASLPDQRHQYTNHTHPPPSPPLVLFKALLLVPPLDTGSVSRIKHRQPPTPPPPLSASRF